MASCSICERFVYAAGLCSRHYSRLRKTGTTDDGPRARKPFKDRIMAKIDRRGVGECWPWTGVSQINGYGVIGRGGRSAGKVLAHRAVFELECGVIPESDDWHGTVVMHTCDNRLCCNPAHLRLGSQADNVRDMDNKGRRKSKSVVGEAHHNSRFTEQDIRKIRSDPRSNAELGRVFGCRRQVIGNIRRRISWKHVP